MEKKQIKGQKLKGEARVKPKTEVQLKKENRNFSISLGKSYFATIHWIPAFAGMTGIYIQTSFRRKPGIRKYSQGENRIFFRL
jgi:hypothetical protein